MAVESSTALDASSPVHQLDIPQTTQACKVLLRHIADEHKRLQTKSSKRNLLAGEESGSEDADVSQALEDTPVWLVLSTKKHITEQKRLKPNKISLPHPINNSEHSTICMITADPQATYTALIDHPTFPTALRSRISRVISLSNLKKNYKSFESRRKLLAEHDIFLADDRIVTYLPSLLGKTFYKGGSKRPIPIGLGAPRERDEDGKRIKLDPASGRKIDPDKISGGRGARTPEQAAKEIEKALGSALVNLAPATTTAIKVARADFTPEMVRDNVRAVVDELAAKFVPRGWRNFRAIHIKGPNSMAFPVWLASELWEDEEDVLEEKQQQHSKKGKAGAGRTKSSESAEQQGEAADQKSKRKSHAPTDSQPKTDAKKKRKLSSSVAVDEDMKGRKEKLRKQKAQALAESG